MTQTTNKQLIGNFGASYVAAKLSSTNCLVRPVVADTDVGVDLFCESVQGKEPFLHFWMQIKAGKQCKTSDDGTAAFPFKVKHLRYWKRQPVPVYAALVPTSWPVRTDPPVYIVNLTEFFLSKELPNKKTVTLKTKEVWQPGDFCVVERFVKNDVPQSTAMLMCQKGVIGSIPQMSSEYEVNFPTIPAGRFSKKVLHQIRLSAAISILFMFQANQLSGKHKTARRKFAGVVWQFVNDPHWENDMALALSAHADSEFDEAISHYERARDRIRNDKKVAELPDWRTRVKIINIQIGKARQGEPPDCASQSL